MNYATVLAVIIILPLAVWLMLPSSVVKEADKWDRTEEFEEELSRQLSSLATDNIIDDLECFSCKILIRLIQRYIAKKSEEELISDVTRPLCSIARQWTSGLASVCNGLVSEFKDELLSVFLSNIAAEEICGFLLNSGGCHVYNPWKQNWTVTIPKANKPMRYNQPNTQKPDVSLIKILHLSDIHIDLEYTEGLNAECMEPVCCRPPNRYTPPGRPAGHWGDYNCDLPNCTLDNLLEHLANNKDEFNWVYWTGDLPPHNIWNQTRSDQLEVLNVVSTKLKDYLGDVKIYPTLGNHESAPVNSFPPPFITDENSNQWLLDAYQADFSHWLPSSTSSTIRKGGFYSVKVAPGLKLISLNMNYCSSYNWWLLINSTDPAGQLQWMISELNASEHAGEKVHIIGHIPPGLCMEVWSWNYNKIVNRYKETIVGQFFGHTHQDEFEIFHDIKDPSKAISVAYIGPSVTPQQDNNPAYRIYDLNNDATFQLVNYHEYYFDLARVNAAQYDDPTWKYLYGAKESYGLKSLQPGEWSDLVDHMETNDTLFGLFMDHYYRRDNIHWNTNDKKQILCLLRTAQSHDTSHCENIEEAYRYYHTHKSC